MRAIDADALQLAIVEEGQANKRKKYIIGDIWELTGAEIREVINSQPTIQPEPCEDAVSRAEAKKILYDFAGHIVDTPNGIYQQAYKTYMSKMDKLPSVTPKQRTGEWIKLDMHRGMADHKCTACEQECYVPTCMGEPMYAFCPNCGAKMGVTE